ncbi:uncharacterized protein LOC132044056 [Lycium ferocissimum]|uniref:uncharacterized protein LOC132044056 n=1 Tax=Lycium ferocissimum TaxID=112874 RepID=UPI00281587D5|nr:uncharacterized protein LOC132044056 [Lycium ferocissimum]
MWIKGLPIKISFFMWRFWKFKLPLDDKLKRWGHQFPSRCFCCQNPDTEDIAHVFLHAPDSQVIWKHFCGPVGIDIQNLHITQVINKWWDLSVQPELRYIYKAVPAIILWEIWKRRNTLRHEGKMTTTKLIYQVMHTLIMFMKVRRRNFKYAPYKWSSVVEALNRYSQPIKVSIVIWKFPDRGWIKVNTDGASRGNPGRSSWGFCVRDENGDVIQAQAKEMEDHMSTNTQAETMAILQALRYLDDNQADRIVIETDSLILKNIIQRVWEVPWQIANMMEDIWTLIDGKTVVVDHIYREGNKVADHLANLALDRGEVVANNFQELDSHGRKLINSDKLEIPYLRIRKCSRT